MVNYIGEEYRKRIDWIEHQLNSMADENGNVLKRDVEAMIFQHYRCSRWAVYRYLETLEGARIISQNSVYLTVEAKKK